MKQIRILLQGLLLSTGVWAQISDVHVNASNTQALIEYAVQGEGTCSVEVSQTPSYSLLVIDVDESKFPGSSLDSRAGATINGVRRQFVAGQRITQRAIDNRVYSRALEAAAVHYFRITCGAFTATGSFTTQTVPFGATYGDPIPADPDNPGETLWPSLDFVDRAKSYTDPHTGALLKRLSGPADVYDVGTGAEFYVWPTYTIDATSPWTGVAYPYIVTNSTASLALRSPGLRFWGSWPYSPANTMSYAGEAPGNLNWIVVRLTAHISSAACNTTATDDCIVLACLSTDGVTCHGSSRLIEVALTTSAVPRLVGSASYEDQGGWLQPGKRWLNGPETTGYTGTLTCDGTTAVTTTGVFNVTWGNGSRITINGTPYTISSIQHESALTLAGACPTGTWLYSAENFSVLIRPKTANAGTITVDKIESQWEFGVPPTWAAASYWDNSSLLAVPGPSGRPGYMIMLPGTVGIYWVDAESGDSRLVAHDAVGCIGSAPQFDPTNGAKWYCIREASAPQSVRSYEYKGDFAERISGPSSGFAYNSVEKLADCDDPVSPSNQPCVVNVTLTTGTNLGSLVTAFDPTFDTTKYASFYSVGTNQDGAIIAFAYRGYENTPGWVIAFNPLVAVNGEPGNAGCVSAAVSDPSRKGCIVAAVPTMLRGPGRGQTLKGDILPNLASGWLRYSPMYTYGNAGDGGGYWQMNTTGGFSFNTTVASGSGFNEVPGGLNQCPNNPFGITGKVCTQLVVTTEPYDANPGPSETGSPEEYITSQVGDYLNVNGSGYRSTAWELVRIIAKNGLEMTVARGQTRGSEACPGALLDCTAGSLQPLISTVNPALVYTSSASAVYWQYAADPHGMGFGMYEDKYLGWGHSSGRFSSQVDNINQHDDAACIARDGCYGLIYAEGRTMQQMLATPRTGYSVTNPPFAGKLSFGFANNVQIHPSQMGHGASLAEREYFLDGRPFNGVYSSTDSARKIAQSVNGQLWKFSASSGNALPLNRRILPTKAQAGWHPLLDISGSGSSIGSTAVDSFRYCVSEVAGECYSGSAKGDVYFNVPRLRFPYCAFPGQAGFGGDASDICILDEALIHDSLMQLKLNVANDETGATQRKLTKGMAVSRMNPPFGNIQALPNNNWGMFRSRFLGGFRSEAMLVKMPPVGTFTSANKGTFRPVLISIPSLPARAVKAIAVFGYGENGTPSQLYCTSRKEACGVGLSTVPDQIDTDTPFYFTESEAASLPGTPCTSGCSIAIPALSGRVLYHRVRFLDSAGLSVSQTAIQAVMVQ